MFVNDSVNADISRTPALQALCKHLGSDQAAHILGAVAGSQDCVGHVGIQREIDLSLTLARTQGSRMHCPFHSHSCLVAKMLLITLFDN